MNQFTIDDARKSQNDLLRAIDQLDDDFTYAEFQQNVFRSTNYFPAINDTEDTITLHKPMYIKEKEVLIKGKLYGLSGTYMSKPVAKVKFDGHYNKSLLVTIKGIVDNIKSN